MTQRRWNSAGAVRSYDTDAEVRIGKCETVDAAIAFAVGATRVRRQGSRLLCRRPCPARGTRSSGCIPRTGVWTMSSHDAELEQMRAGVSCAVLLERHPPPWQLDEKQSTRHCLKYRRAESEILLVTHEGRGWWDPGSTAKGDVFGLVQYLNPGLNFGEVRKLLRPFIGLSPSYPIHEACQAKVGPVVPFDVKWDSRRRPARGSPTWRYLTEQRRLPPPIVLAAVYADALREGPYASAWFAHRDHEATLTGIEMRGPDYRGFSPGGEQDLVPTAGQVEDQQRPGASSRGGRSADRRHERRRRRTSACRHPLRRDRGRHGARHDHGAGTTAPCALGHAGWRAGCGDRQR